jgi:purine-binding chemotaxis protein CheW
MTTNYLLFELSGRLFGVKLDGAIEILPWRSSRRVPQAYSYVEGLLDYRGVVYPVLNIAQQLGMVKPAPAGTISADSADTRGGQSIILLEVNKNPFGIVVDLVVKMTPLASLAASVTKPQGVDPTFIQGIVLEDGREIMILDGERLLHAG